MSNKWSTNELNYLKEHYQDMTNTQLANILCRSKAAVDLKLSRLGLKKSKYHYNKLFFQNIDNEDKAYWCGFIMADGGVSIHESINSCELSIKLQARDASHLRKFNLAIHGNVPVNVFRRRCNLNQKFYDECQIRLYSEQIVHDLGRYGVIPNKSLIKQFPKNIDNVLMRHYIRGYFDGNGSISGAKKRNGYPKCKFTTGSLDFATGLSQYLKQHQICENHLYATRNYWTVDIAGLKNIDKFLHYIYDDSTIYLDRKKKKKDDIYNYLNIEQRLDRRSEMGG